MKKRKNFLPFNEAKLIAQKDAIKHNIASALLWGKYTKHKLFPANIPTRPHVFYKNKGWISWKDWLGNNKIRSNTNNYLPFKQAIDAIQSDIQKYLINSSIKWRLIYCKKGLRPQNIPPNPEKVYKNKGWVSWTDILPRLKLVGFFS